MCEDGRAPPTADRPLCRLPSVAPRPATSPTAPVRPARAPQLTGPRPPGARRGEADGDPRPPAVPQRPRPPVALGTHSPRTRHPPPAARMFEDGRVPPSAAPLSTHPPAATMSEHDRVPRPPRPPRRAPPHRAPVPIRYNAPVSNRRSQVRHPVHLSAQLRHGGQAYDCTITNLSLGGCFVTHPARLPLGTRVEVSFRIPEYEQPISVGGAVRWANESGAGIQFDGLRAQEVWALNKFFVRFTVEALE
ncbi:MAG: hypothetical protein D6689_18050 [Deltaproteobacteria bacterium]|nr:MAG: hypothetical protein D6689_18050 [Deltaproteobacteria bacterium]